LTPTLGVQADDPERYDAPSLTGGVMGREREQAQRGVKLLREAILTLLERSPEGLTNAQVADELGIRSTYKTGSKDYFSWSLLGQMLTEGRIIRRGARYVLHPR
jgi:hypothetical protein